MSRCSVLFLPSLMTSSLSDDTAVTHQPSIERVRERERERETRWETSSTAPTPPVLCLRFKPDKAPCAISNRTLCIHRTANPSTCKLSGKYCTGFDIWPHTNTHTHTHTHKQTDAHVFIPLNLHIHIWHACCVAKHCMYFFW